MNIEFTAEDTKIKVQYKEDIVIDGQIVGWVEVSQQDGKFRVYAGLYLTAKGIGRELIQGFGETKEEAVVAGLVNNRERYARAISEIDDISRRIYA